MTEYTIEDARLHGWLADIVRPGQTAANALAPLSGLRYFAKDLFDIEGHVTKAGSRALSKNPPAKKSADIIGQLDGAGALFMGTSNMEALAYGFVTNSPIYGMAKNPFDLSRICGGSSGGSAALVAAGLADFALGTDTSGSIRVPAAFTGVYGLKPTLGRLSHSGVVPLSPTLDRVGLFASNPGTLQKVFDCIDQGAEADPTTVPSPRIAKLSGYFADDVSAPVSEAIEDFCQRNEITHTAELADAERARAAAYIIVAAEAATLHEAGLRDTPGLFDPETRTRLLAAQAIPKSWLDKALEQKQLFQQICEKAFKNADVLIAPCVPCIAPTIEEVLAPTIEGQPPLRASLGVYTQPISLVGLPVVALPLPTKTGLPTAVQLIGRPGEDRRLLRLACDLALRNPS